MTQRYLGLPAEVSTDMPEDEICFVDQGNVVGLICNIGKPKAIEPAGIDKLRPHDKWLPSDGHWMIDAYPLTPDECDVSPLMRRLGYNTNPLKCLHYRKRMYAGMKTFNCMDCGMENV